MQISITINDAELPERLRQIFEIVPKSIWRHRCAALADRERHNPHLSNYFDERYTIERHLGRALAYWSQQERLPSVKGPDGGRYYHLYSFIHVLSWVYPCLSAKGQARVRGCLMDGLQSEVGLAAFAHELAVAVHLSSAGFDVEFTDIEGRARFDLLAQKEDLRLEVDCKTASADVGRKIHRRRAIELFNRIQPDILEKFSQPAVGRTLDIVLPGPLHGAESYMKAVASVVSNAIALNESLSIAEIADVSLGKFDIYDEPTLVTNGPTSEAIERVAERLERKNQHRIWLGSPERRAAVVAVVSSREPDKVADGIYRALKKSAEGQFSGSNPALLAANLLDLTPGQLHELASGPSSLGAIANRLFRGERREHLFGVAFVSPADTPTEAIDVYGAALSGRGTALFFRREGHPLSQDPRLVLFKGHRQTDHPILDRLPFWTARVGGASPA
jgi:hypothetical protein